MQFLVVFRACFSADKFPGWIRTVTNPILVVSFFDGSGSETAGATASTPKYICYQIVLATKFSFHKKEKYERVKGEYGKKQKNYEKKQKNYDKKQKNYDKKQKNYDKKQKTKIKNKQNYEKPQTKL